MVSLVRLVYMAITRLSYWLDWLMDRLQFCYGKFSLTGLHGNYISYVNECLVIPEVNIYTFHTSGDFVVCR